MRISFEGHSDDIVAVTINGNTEEYPVQKDHVFSVTSLSGIGIIVGVKVLPVYAGGTWGFAVMQFEEDEPIPEDWGFEIETAHAYSTKLIVDTCGDKARLMYHEND